MALATLTVDITAKLASLEAGLSKAGQIAANHAAAIEARFAAAGNAVGKSLQVVGGAAFVAGIATFVRHTFEGVDALNDLADATGASIENISALEDVALRTGASYETLEKALIKFNAQLKEAGDPKSGAAEVLKNLGLSADELRKKDPALALVDVAKALMEYEGNATRARYVQELFGKSVGEVGPLLKDLAENGKLNATVTKEQAEEYEKLGKELSAFRKNITDAARGILSDFIPGINKLLERLRTAKEVFGGFGNFVGAASSQFFSGKTFTDAGEALAFYNSELKNTDAAIVTIKNRMAGGGQTFIERRNDPGDLKVLQDRRTELAQFAEMYRRFANEGGAGAGRGTGVAEPLRKLKELVGGAKPEDTKGFEDYTIRVNKAIAHLIEGTPTAKLGELNAILNELDSGVWKNIDPKILEQVRTALLPPGGAAVGPPISDELKRVLDLLDDTGTIKLRNAQRDLDLLRAEFDRTTAGTERWYALADAILDVETSISDMIGGAGIQAEQTMTLLQDFQQTVVEGIGSTISMSLRGEFDNVGRMWENLLIDMAARAIQAQIGKRLLGDSTTEGLFSVFFKWLASANGNVFAGGTVTPFAYGGIVDKPTPFAFGGSNLGVMGEAGPEAILPLRRGRDGALGVASSGGGPSIVMHQNVYVQAGVSRSDMAAVAGDIRRSTVAEVRDLIRRGNLAIAG